MAFKSDANGKLPHFSPNDSANLICYPHIAKRVGVKATTCRSGLDPLSCALRRHDYPGGDSLPPSQLRVEWSGSSFREFDTIARVISAWNSVKSFVVIVPIGAKRAREICLNPYFIGRSDRI